MTAVTIPFPVARRPHYLRDTARDMAKATPARYEALLYRELRALRDRLEEAGVARPLIEEQLSSLDANLRRELWGILLRDEGGAA
jgi:hypothetical protein